MTWAFLLLPQVTLPSWERGLEGREAHTPAVLCISEFGGWVGKQAGRVLSPPPCSLPVTAPPLSRPGSLGSPWDLTYRWLNYSESARSMGRKRTCHSTNVPQWVGSRRIQRLPRLDLCPGGAYGLVGNAREPSQKWVEQTSKAGDTPIIVNAHSREKSRAGFIHSLSEGVSAMAGGWAPP